MSNSKNDLSYRRLKEVFKEIDARWGILPRTSRHYVQIDLYPKPEIRGRTGYYDLEKTQLIERAGLIKRFREDFRCSPDKVRKILNRAGDVDYKEWLSQIESFLGDYPVERHSDIKGKRCSFRSNFTLMARLWFADIMEQQGKISDEQIKKESEVWKLWNSDEVQAALCYYGAE